MKLELLCIAAFAILVSACNDVGACRSDGPDGWRGVGGGPIGPSGGGFGDEPTPHPQAEDGEGAPPGCSATSRAACDAACGAERDQDTAACADMPQSQREACALAAASRYSGCSAGCAGAGDEDPVEKCRQECDREYEERNAVCRKIKNKDKRVQCWMKSNDEYGECLKKCK